MRASLNDLLPDALNRAYALPCFNVFGYEDAVAIIRGAEACNAPIIIATNKEMVEFMGTRQLASMLGILADDASVPVCVHLDHCYEVDIAKAAVDSGYSSVMFDGSQLELQHNIDRTRRVADYAHQHGVSVEGEIGSVPYSVGRDHIRSELTEPAQAQAFAAQSQADAVAVSIGNVHRLTKAGCPIDFERLAEIDALVEQPLVIHGTTGISEDDLVKLSATSVCKFNVGTRLRMAFGESMRHTLADKPDEFDRLTIFNDVMPVMTREAIAVIELMRIHQQA